MFMNDTIPLKKNINPIIIDNILNKLDTKQNITISEEHLLLDYLVTSCLENIENYFNIDTSKNPLTNKCDYAQKILGTSISNLGITVYPKETQETILPHVTGHSFLVVVLPNNSYIVDPTYNQFLTIEGCNPQNFIVYNNAILKTPDPGLFIMQTNEGRNLANNLVSNGYIPLTEENAKIYCDSFYYTNQGTNLINGKMPISPISGEIYLNSLLKENHRYSVSDERFNELYPPKKEVSK